MASQHHDAVFREEDVDEDDDESQEDEEFEEDDDVLAADDEENERSPSTALAVTVAVPGSGISNGGAAPLSTSTATTIVIGDSSDPKRRRVEPIEEKKPPPPLDDSRRLFQRLWTDEDEIELLQGFLDYTSQRGSSHHNDTALFYDQIKSKLQLDFNKNQLVEKIRRLKKKYRNVLNKIGSGKEFSFKSPHDQATFEISRKIWSSVAPIGENSLDDDEINPCAHPNPSPHPNLNFSPVIHKNETPSRNSAEKKTPKRSRPRSAVKVESNDGSALNRDHNCTSNATATVTPTATATNTTATATTTNNNCNSGYSNNIPSLIEETVRSCLSPVLRGLMGAMGGGAFGGRGSMNLNPLPFMNLGYGGGELVDEKWRKQQILELEVYSKRLELVQDQIKFAMEELRSGGGGGGGGGGG